MSTEEKQTTRRAPAGGRGTFRKRRPPTTERRPRPTTKPAGDSKPKTADNGAEAPKRERPANYNWPAADVGKNQTGTVVSVIRRGKFNFGFISLSTEKDFYEQKYPRVYFNPSHVGTAGLFLRTGYQVQFTATNDEEGRSVATNIVLTEEGNQTKAEREEAIAKKRAERQADEPTEEKAEGDHDRRRRRFPRAPRKEVDGRKVSLKVTSEGSSETKNVEADLGHSIGALKANSFALFNAPSNYAIYFGGNILTREAYSNLQDNNTVHLAPRKEN